MFDEKTTVEDYFIEQLTLPEKHGWTFVSSDDLPRESFAEPLLLSVLVGRIKSINASQGIGDEELRQALNELSLRASSQEGSKAILHFLKFGIPVKFEKDKIVKFIQLIDYENIANNDFIISRQVVCQNAGDFIRPDIMLYVNGIPLVIIECKNPVSLSVSWLDGYKDIKGYENKLPELFKYVQIGIAAEKTARYFPIVPWLDEVKTCEWKSEGKDSIDACLELLNPATLLDMLKNFIFYREEAGTGNKVIARYVQFRAANKIVDRVSANFAGKEQKNKGLIWHWQGSGKTLTMIFAALKLFYIKQLDTPSIFFIVDRQDLQEQLAEEFASLDVPKPHLIDSIEELKNVIRHNEFKGRRDLMITLIHKFRPEELASLTAWLSESDRHTIQSRKDIITFIDEGHRTQYGPLSAQMRQIFANASHFAFTGTPLAKKGRNTYTEFSYPPDEQYLDKYFVSEALKDKFTEKIVYQPRLEKEVHLEKGLLDAFLDSEFEEIPEEIKEGVKHKLTPINAFLENPERVAAVSKDIAEHFKTEVNGKYKAMVVAANRKACVQYKRELDKLLPKEWSEIVMTMGPKDEKTIAGYYTEITGRFRGKDIDEIRRAITYSFKEEENPRILIVTDMLLTGFDAPILQTMYLVKPLKEHRLLQAIARTNRPYKDIKDAGLVIDYVGILKEFKRAFANYSAEDVGNVLMNMDDLRRDFIADINEMSDIFKSISKKTFSRKNLLSAIELLTSDEETGKRFEDSYKRARKTFELLGPDKLKVEFFEEYGWFSAVYAYYIKETKPENYENKDKIEKYFQKTLKYVYETTELKELQQNLPEIDFDEHYLRKLDEKIKNREEKAANIVFTLNKFVLVDKNRNLLLWSISDKVEELLKQWREKKKDYEKICRDGTLIIEELEKIKERQEKTGLSDMEYAILLILEQKIGKREDLVSDVKKIADSLKTEMFEGWVLQPSARKKVEKELRYFLRGAIIKYGLSYDELDKLFLNVKENIIEYGKNN